MILAVVLSPLFTNEPLRVRLPAYLEKASQPSWEVLGLIKDDCRSRQAEPVPLHNHSWCCAWTRSEATHCGRSGSISPFQRSSLTLLCHSNYFWVRGGGRSTCMTRLQTGQIRCCHPPHQFRDWEEGWVWSHSPDNGNSPAMVRCPANVDESNVTRQCDKCE